MCLRGHTQTRKQTMKNEAVCSAAIKINNHKKISKQINKQAAKSINELKSK